MKNTPQKYEYYFNLQLFDAFLCQFLTLLKEIVFPFKICWQRFYHFLFFHCRTILIIGRGNGKHRLLAVKRCHEHITRLCDVVSRG